MSEVTPVIEALEELYEDSAVPKNIKSRIQTTITVLQEDGETTLKISRALHELEGLTDDVNMQPYTRTQLFNVVSLLEMI